MESFEFVIPLQKDDLKSFVEGQYSVDKVYSKEDILQELDAFIISVKNEGGKFILNNFDVLYSIILEFNNFEWNDLHKIYDTIIFKCVKALTSVLENDLHELSKDARARVEYLNILKMTMYIYCQFFQCYMNKINLKTDSAGAGNIEGQKKKKMIEQHGIEYSWNWEDKQQEGLKIIQTILLQEALCYLWDPPVAEESFINLIADCCYKVLEQSSTALVKSKPLKNLIVNIIGVLIKQYNYGLSFVEKSVQLLKRHEHVSSILSEAVMKYVGELGFKSLIKHFINEIHEASELLTSFSDNHCAKSFLTFLAELSLSCPNEFEPNLNDIFLFLDSELPMLRILGLSVLTNVLISCLSIDEAENSVKENRKRCLEALSDHIEDINAPVRAKVLQLWHNIVSAGFLPKDWIIPLMVEVMERLTDVSAMVTKHAIHLIRLMMETNPFASMLSLNELMQTLEEQKNIYKEMEKNKYKVSNDEKETMWSSFEAEFKLFLQEYLKEGSNLRKAPDSPDLTKPHMPTICLYIAEKHFDKAMNLFVHVEQKDDFQKIRSHINMDDIDYYLSMFKAIFLNNENDIEISKNNQSMNHNLNDSSENNDVLDKHSSALADQKKRIKFYLDCVDFVEHLNKATEKVVDLLSSDQINEVVEAIEFITLAKRFGVAGSEAGIVQMMKLISCPEESIRNSATKAFEQLFLHVDSNSEKEISANPALVAKQVIENLCSLVKSMKLVGEDALNSLVKEWIKMSTLNSYCTAAIVSKFSSNGLAGDSDDCIAALILFSSVIQSKPELVNQYLEELTKELILRSRKNSKHKDLRVVRQICKVLPKASSHQSRRFPNKHTLIQELYNCVIDHFNDRKEKCYLYMAEEAINICFKLALRPQELCGNLLSCLHDFMVKKSSLNSLNKSSEDASTHSSISKKSTASMVEALTRFLFIVGHVALRLCLYLEKDVLEEKKRLLREELDAKTNSKQIKGKNEAEDELNMAVDFSAANEDAISEEIRLICENEILYGQGIISRFKNLPITILKNGNKYSNLRLRSVASVTMGQFMLVSQKYCKENIQLFITILENTEDTLLKNNLIILFGELLFRHPNVMEPWISYMYSRLRSPCSDVRLNALCVISHLITNEMVKVKSQISDVATCIVDTEDEIKESAKRLFHELSLKKDTLYNVLPDIISVLSNPDAKEPLSEENFKLILRHIIELIQKEKQMELLIEKLCERLINSNSERQWTDLCFCLSLFTYSEKSIRKLIDYYNAAFAKKLHCNSVYDCLTGIIESANKSSKPAVKEAAAELSALLGELNDADEEESNKTSKLVGRNNDNTLVIGSAMKKSVAKRATSCKKPTRATTTKKKQKKNKSNSGSNSSSSDDEFVKRKSRPARNVRRMLIIENDSEEDS